MTDAAKVQGTPVSTTPPTEGQTLVSRNGTLTPESPQTTTPSVVAHGLLSDTHTDAFDLTYNGGVSFTVGPGVAAFAEAVYPKTATNLTLTGAATNFIHITSAGVVNDVTTGWPAGSIPLWLVVMSGAVPTQTTDMRALFARGGGGGGGSALTVQEIDGAPIDTAVTIIRVPNSTLTDNGAGDVTLAFSDTAHIADTADAHDASAISILDTAADFTATNVEDALAELQSDSEAHTAASDPHGLGAGYIKGSATPGGELGGTYTTPTVDTIHGGVHPITQGGTGQITAQLAINALSAVSAATNEHVLTKDTGTGNAIFKAAAGGSGHTIRENGVDQTARTGLNFTDPDVATALISDDVGNDETEVILSLYALRSGRSGGQAIFGGTGINTYLSLQGNSVDATDAIKLLSPLQVAANPNNVVLDSVGTTRISIDSTTPHVTITGDSRTSGGTFAINSALAANTQLTMQPALGSITGDNRVLYMNPTSVLNANNTSLTAISAQVASSGAAGTTGLSLIGLDFVGTAISAAASTSTFSNIMGVRCVAKVSANGAAMTTNVTNLIALQCQLQAQEILSGNINVTDAIILNVSPPAISGTPVITNMYGIKIGAMTTGSGTNRLPFYEAGTAAGDNHGNRLRSNTQFGSVTGQFGGGDGCVSIATATTLPVGGGSNSVIMYVKDVAGVKRLHCRISNGTEVLLS